MAKCICVTVDVSPLVVDLAASVTYSGHDADQRKTMHKICDKACTIFMRGFSIS